METKYFAMHHEDALKRRSAAIQKSVKQLVSAMQIAVPIVEKWDGKELTRRLTTAIQKEVDTKLGINVVHVSMSYEGYSDNEITFWCCERGYKDAPSASGYSTTSYVDDELHTRVPFKKSFKVEAEEIVQSLNSRIRWNKNVAYKYADAEKNFKKYLERYAKAVEAFQTACGEINPLFVPSEVSTYKGYYPNLSPWETERDKHVK